MCGGRTGKLGCVSSVSVENQTILKWLLKNQFVSGRISSDIIKEWKKKIKEKENSIVSERGGEGEKGWKEDWDEIKYY